MALIEGEGDRFRRVSDIGRGGFCLTTSLPLSVGDRVPVRLRFPDLFEEVRLEARVAWRWAGHEMGFELSHVDSDDIEEIRVMVAHQEHFGRMALLC